MTEQADTRELVRSRYAQAAATILAGSTASCCDPTAAAGEEGSCAADAAPLEADERFGAALYDPEQTGTLPVEAVLASLGCGNPTAVADLHPGERVLDLGSGGGIDVLLSARRVGPTGFAYGVDMTAERLQLARVNAAKAGATNVEFMLGSIEDIPLPDASVDVAISNCVINLSVDKPAVLREMFPVLVPGGRIVVSDVVADDHLTATDRAARGSYVGCIAGALSRSEYLAGLAEVGFVNATVEFTHETAPGLHSAIIRGSKPDASTATARSTGSGPAEAASSTACCDTAAASDCYAPEVKASCCGGDPDAPDATAAALPSTCGCR
jgi:arsenite methyltransferase